MNGYIKPVLKDTYGKTKTFEILPEIPKVGDDGRRWLREDGSITEVKCVDDMIAETTSGDPKRDYTFYKITIERYDGDTFGEYVCAERGE